MMKKNFLGYCLVIVALASSCLDENRVEPARPATFVRYINGGNPDSARALEKTPDGGFVILANTRALATDTTGLVLERVKLVKVDQYGGILWTRVLPENRESGVVGYRGYGIIVSDDGYNIYREVINMTGK